MAEPSATVASAQDLSVRFPGADRDALHEVTLAIAGDERIAVLGPSGSGKSTLALALAGAIPALVPATVGGRLSRAEACALVQQDVDAQLVALSVEGEIAFALENRGLPPEVIDARIADALAAGPAAGLAPGDATLTLSTGWRQRLALAAALAERSPLTILDEPTAHLDEEAASAAIATMAASAAGALLMVEHRADLVAPIASRMLLLDRDGAPVALGDPGSVLEAMAARPDLGLRLPPATSAALALREQGLWPGGCLPVGPTAWPALGPRAAAAAVAALAPPPPAGSPAGQPRLLVEDAALRRGGRDVLRGVSLALAAGEIVGVAGRNGAGKTSLAQLCAGLVRPSQGTRTMRTTRPPGLVPQNPTLVFASASLSDEARRRGLDWPAAAGALAGFGIEPDPRRHPLHHSRGEMRRIALALALAAPGPFLVVLDEPTAGLDAAGLSALDARLSALAAAGGAGLVVSHDVDWLARVCRRIVVLEAGRLVAEGPAERIRHAAARGVLPLAPPPGAALALACGWTPAHA